MVGPHHSISPPPPLCGPGCPSRAACQRPRQGALSGPAPTGQFRVCRKLWVCRKPALRQLLRLGCLENFVARPRVQRRLARLHVPDRAVVVRVPSPSPSTGERRRPRHAAHPSSSGPRPPSPTGNWPLAGGPRGLPPPVWAGWPAPTAPPPPRLGGPPPRADATGTSERGRHDAPAVGPSAWPGASRLVIPLPARPLCLARRRSQPPSRAPLARWLLASLDTPRPHLGGEVASKP